MKNEVKQIKDQINQTVKEQHQLAIKMIREGCEIIDASAYPTVKELQAAIDQKLADGYKPVTSISSLLIFTK